MELASETRLAKIEGGGEEDRLQCTTFANSFMVFLPSSPISLFLLFPVSYAETAAGECDQGII